MWGPQPRDRPLQPGLYLKPLGRTLAEVIPENYPDLRDLKRLLPSLKIEDTRSWRDKYHGFQDRIMILQELTPFQISYQGPLALRVRTRTRSGARRTLVLRVGTQVQLKGPEDWYQGQDWSPMEQPYYLGLDANSLVHGSIRGGKLVTQGTEYYQTKTTGHTQLEQKIDKVLTPRRALGYTLIYFARPPLLSTLRVEGVTPVDLQGYAQEGWRPLVPGIQRQETLARDHLRMRRKGLTQVVLDRVQDWVQSGNVARVYVVPSIDPQVFTHLWTRVGEDKIQVLGAGVLGPRILPQGFGLVRYF